IKNRGLSETSSTGASPLRGGPIESAPPLVRCIRAPSSGWGPVALEPRAEGRPPGTRRIDARSFAFRHFIKPVARAPPARRPVCGRAAPSTRPSEGELSMAVVRPFRLPLLLLALGALVPTAGAQVSNKPIAGVTQPRVMT